MEKLKEFAKEINQLNGDVWYVGGYVRDSIMGVSSQDIDIVITGIDIPSGLEVLKRHSQIEVNQVVSIAPVFIAEIDNVVIEFAFGRKEISTGNNKNDFYFETENVSIEDDLFRRDFTVNAIAKHVLSNEIIDPFNGISDIEKRILRHVSGSFVESPERVLRLASFAARFDFEIADETIELCKSIPRNVPKEQIWRHINKAFSKAKKPSRWLDCIIRTEWCDLFPEIENMIDIEQNPIWHPEGDVITHTMMVMDEINSLCDDKKVEMILTTLCHDMGKAHTTFVNEDGFIVSPGHESTDDCFNFLTRINAPNKTIDFVTKLVKMHMRHNNGVSKRIVRRILKDLDDIDIKYLGQIIQADHSGRSPLPKKMPDNMVRILELADEMENRFIPLIMGRDLIDLGEKPGNHFGNILRMAEQAQLDGIFDNKEDGLIWLRRWLNDYRQESI